jgi:hypothetical protein
MHAKSIHQNSRKVKIGRGSKVRDSGTRGEWATVTHMADGKPRESQ